MVFSSAQAVIAADAEKIMQRMEMASQTGQYRNIGSVAERAVRYARDALGEQGAYRATMLNAAGVTFFDIGRHGDAVDALQEAYTLRSDFYGERHPRTIETLTNLAVAFE